MLYFNHGIRSGGGIGDLLTLKSPNEGSIFWIRWVADMIFYISVILLVLNMINGIIISTFSSIREDNENKSEDIENKCFICSIDRSEFEKRKLSFESHCNDEHCYETYIKYLVSLKLMNIKEVDADQAYILKCIKNREITFFPVGRSMSLGDIEEVDDDNDLDD